VQSESLANPEDIFIVDRQLNSADNVICWGCQARGTVVLPLIRHKRPTDPSERRISPAPRRACENR